MVDSSDEETSTSASGVTESIEEPKGKSDDEEEEEKYEVHDKVAERFFNMKMLLHTKLAVPKDVEMPPYRLLGCFNPDEPELWGHALASLAEEWVCSYLNTSGGILLLGIESDGIIQGIPLNTHPSQLHSFLTPFFSTLDRFWPSVSHGLVTVMLLPVHTPVAPFEPYYVVFIRVRKGPFPCYLNSNDESYEGDYVLKKLTKEDIKGRAGKVDARLMSKYLTSYCDKETRNELAFGEVITGGRPLIFRYSSHWSHPPLTLVPEAATTGMVGKSVIISTEGVKECDANRAPCDHSKWKVQSSETANGRCRLQLLCMVCNNVWKVVRKGTQDDVLCRYFSKKGSCTNGATCRYVHAVASDEPPKPPRRRPLSGLSRTPQQTLQPAPKRQRVEQGTANTAAQSSQSQSLENDEAQATSKQMSAKHTPVKQAPAKTPAKPLCPIIPHVPLAPQSPHISTLSPPYKTVPIVNEQSTTNTPAVATTPTVGANLNTTAAPATTNNANPGTPKSKAQIMRARRRKAPQ
eukprot:TRINITY_DN11339_c0_g2_i1.p1 TRINITY_DN11339_c0_g2~~TRINITY_DN11339_c0_g2_i1.p1  ORF type:complete len:520 (+),score=110.39 TRINITY_DN11339_c0_g2_i1:40-1599(+)